MKIALRNLTEKLNGILLPKLLSSTVRKKCSSDLENLWKFVAEGQEFAKFLKRSEQFLITEQFFNLFLEVSHIHILIENKKILGF